VSEIPVKSYPKGGRKALAAMQKRYGTKKGKAIFYARANKLGKGKTRLQKIRSVYSKGAHPVSKKRSTRTRKRSRKR